MKRITRLAVFFALTALVLLVGAGSYVHPTHTGWGSPGWSRGLRLGLATSPDQPAMALDPASDRLVLAWPVRPDPDDVGSLRLLKLDTTSGAVSSKRDLPAFSNYPRKPILLPAGQKGLHLLWLDGLRTERSLRYRFLDPDGAATGSITRLSSSEEHVRDAKAASMPDGGLVVLWTTGLGSFLLHLDATGEPLVAPLPLPEALSVDLAVDSQGMVHLAWVERVSLSRCVINYATLQPDASALPASRSVSTLICSSQSGGMSLQLEEKGIYVIWSREVGGEMGVAEMMAFVFATDEASDNPKFISFEAAFPPDYELVEQSAALSRLAQLTVNECYCKWHGASVHRMSSVLPDRGDRTVLALGLEAQTRSQNLLQPGLVVLDDGQAVGYTYAAWTEQSSVGVSAVVDDAGNFYTAWVDASGIANEHPVYLAATSDALQSVFNRLTLADVLAALPGIIDGVAHGMVFLFPAIFWLIIPMAWLIIALWWGEGYLGPGTAWVVLLIALVLHLGSKYVITTDLLSLLPRLGYVPSEWVQIVVYLTPVVTVMIGLVLAWLVYIRRRDQDFPVPAYLIAAVTDIVLSVSLHGIAFVE